MSPNFLASSPPSAPRLEYFLKGSTELHRVTIEQSPFKIGRCESSDLRIDSAQVSRAHAQIYQRGNLWSIRDLGSTNGTQVNGKPVREAVLSDGDILAIAETELTFVASSVSPFERMVTQPIQPRESTKQTGLLPPLISQTRALTEAMLAQTIPLQMATVVSLSSGECDACLAQILNTTSLFDQELQLSATHAVAERFRELARLQAIKIAHAHTMANRIFVTIDLAELESPDQLFSNLDELRDGIALDCELGVAIRLPKLLDRAALSGMIREIRNADLLLAIVDFQGSISQIADLASSAPEYLVLSDTMLQGLTASSQSLHWLQVALTTCREIGIKPVLPHGPCQRTIGLCRQIGYDFAVQTMAPADRPDHGNAMAFAREPSEFTSRIGLEVS